tara:strand:+ start:221 stop:1018 length:798 start_codon:yes stop_codon:yes gene_type:complete
MNYYNLISMMPKAVAYDADAQAFITATGISGTNASAINTLVIDLKAASIWSKMKALYPIIGGTATSHKFNLKNPLDTDAAFRLVFAGGVTHSSNGFEGNGTNGFANTFVNPNTLFTSGFASFGIYNKKLGATGFFMGTQVGSINFISIRAQLLVNIRHQNRGSSAVQTNHTVVNDLGFTANSRTSNTLMTSIDNTGAFQTITTNVTIAYSGFIIPLLVNNSSGAYNNYSNGQLSFAYISDALTSSELTSLKSINQTYQTTLGRQV